MIFLNTNVILNLHLKEYVILVEIVETGAWEPQSQVGLQGHTSLGGQAGKQTNVLYIFTYVQFITLSVYCNKLK